jgi:hypothetical protein
VRTNCDEHADDEEDEWLMGVKDGGGALVLGGQNSREPEDHDSVESLSEESGGHSGDEIEQAEERAAEERNVPNVEQNVAEVAEEGNEVQREDAE